MSKIPSSLCIPFLLILLLTGCSTFTGIPSHGGGKRFFIEQELVAASAMSLDLSELSGKRCSIRVVSMGDQGGGNMIGGRYEWQAAIRGSYAANPPTRTQNQFPLIDSLTTTRDGAGAVLSAIESSSPLNFPGSSRSQQQGGQSNIGAGVAYNGFPTYQSTGFINPNDAVFLDSVIREACILQGVILTAPNQAEYIVLVNVDVFGTHRSRTEMHIYNQERLRAKTALQVTVIDRKGELFLAPQTASYEADYRERFIFWCGPLEVEKRVYKSDDLLISYVGLGKKKSEEVPAIASKATDLGEYIQPFVQPKKNRTRPNQLTRPRTLPKPNRMEDILPAYER